MHTSLLDLPNELLAEVAGYCVTLHPQNHYAIDNRRIIALSAVSRRLRSVAAPCMYQDIIITSDRQLNAIATVFDDIAAWVREINIFLDVDFYALFKACATRRPSVSSPFTTLSSLLARSKILRALRILVGESTGEHSPWTRTFLMRPDGIPVGNVFKQTLGGVRLPHLRILELDAFSDVGSLLRRTPNLTKLRLAFPAGYAQYTNHEFITALRHVPKLKELSYSAGSLLVEAEPQDSSDDHSSVELLIEIGQSLPELERLDLQSRWYGEDVMYVTLDETISPEMLKEAAHHLQNLKELKLPTSLGKQKDTEAAGASELPSIEQLIVAEQHAISSVSHIVPRLQLISFLRPSHASNEEDSCIEYQLGLPHDPQSRREATLFTPRPLVVTAWDSFIDARPRDLLDAASKPEWSVRGLRASATAFTMQNQAAAVVLASVGGLIFGEAGRFLYSHLPVTA